MLLIELADDIINGIFDPRIELRKARLLRTQRINRIFLKMCSNGMILTWNDQRLIVFNTELLVYDNLTDPQSFHIAVWPIFQIEPESNQVEEGNPIIIQCESFTFRKKPERIIQFSDGSSLSPIISPMDKAKFIQWKTLYDSSKFHLPYSIHLRLADMRHELMSQYIYSPSR